ncbi:MAG: ABC transporter permease [Dactylosporangium sp.]|nr:ABC transporter permease [Dactylosporangium sp.]
MASYILRRLGLMVPTMLGIAAIVFLLMQIIPGDPAAVLLGQNATPEGIRDMRHALGLDRPLGVQFGAYLAGVVRGDLGDSIFQHEPVARLVFAHLPATLELAVGGLLISVLIGVPLGVVAAVRRGSLVDMGSMMFAQLGVSVPVFWLGIMLMLWFAVQLGWFPAIGRGEPILAAIWNAVAGRPGELVESLRHLAMPAFTLGVYGAAVISRMVRASLVESLREDYVRTARAKGLSGWRVVYLHALRNALLPVVSILGLQFGVLLGGAVVTETIFGWPGVGQLAVTAISQRDIPLVQGTVLVIALLFSIVNLGVDLLYAAINPRIRFQ